jgi:hypothetical protein
MDYIMSLILQSSGGGQITVQEPATASNFTQTLPAATGTVMVSGNMPAFSVSRTGSNQTITANTFTKVQLNTEEFDTNNCFDSTTNYRFTPTVAGYYQINGAINSESSSGTITRCIATVYKNGSEFKRGSDNNVSATFISVVNSLIYFNGTTDYVELYAFISATTAVIAGSATLTYFNGSMVRAA